MFVFAINFSVTGETKVFVENIKKRILRAEYGVPITGVD